MSMDIEIFEIVCRIEQKLDRLLNDSAPHGLTANEHPICTAPEKAGQADATRPVETPPADSGEAKWPRYFIDEPAPVKSIIYRVQPGKCLDYWDALNKTWERPLRHVTSDELIRCAEEIMPAEVQAMGAKI